MNEKYEHLLNLLDLEIKKYSDNLPEESEEILKKIKSELLEISFLEYDKIVLELTPINSFVYKLNFNVNNDKIWLFIDTPFI